MAAGRLLKLISLLTLTKATFRSIHSQGLLLRPQRALGNEKWRCAWPIVCEITEDSMCDTAPTWSLSVLQDFVQKVLRSGLTLA
jgi:hypothetical protein